MRTIAPEVTDNITGPLFKNPATTELPWEKGNGLPPATGKAPRFEADERIGSLNTFICQQREQRRSESDAERNIEHSIEYMRQHLGEPLRAATLAAVANMSLPHYFAVFKRRVGCTPIDYFIKLRMKYARQLLAETSWSIKEVAGALGYDDPLYFSRVFKAVNHSTPTAYRANHKVA